MEWIAVPITLAVAPLAVLAVYRLLLERQIVALNYRQRSTVNCGGLAALAAALVALIPLGIAAVAADRQPLPTYFDRYALFVVGATLLGLIDDLVGSGERGLRAHAQALARGRASTGALKAIGVLSLALVAARGSSFSAYVVEALLLAATTHVVNLFDTKSGRAVKIFVVSTLAVVLASWELGALSALWVFVIPVLVVGVLDLREKVMLGNVGANLVGALLALTLAASLDRSAQLIALAAVLAISIYGEFRSLGKLIEKTPLLRALDSWGRPST